MDLVNSPICHIHNIIRDKAITMQEILEGKDKSNIITTMNQIELHSLCVDIIALSEYAEKQGQAMEDRLKIYRNGIESLGFKRDK